MQQSQAVIQPKLDERGHFFKSFEKNMIRLNVLYNWNSGSYSFNYFWRNMATDREIQITEEEFNNQSQPSL